MRVLLLVVMAALPDHSYALSICYEPRDPGCPVLGDFGDSLEFEMCKGDIERYRRAIDNYLDCLDGQKQEAVDAFNKAVRRFNCAAERKTVCY